MALRKTSKAGSSSSLPTISEKKSKKASMQTHLATKAPLPSISLRGIIAARILSHKIKEKSERLAAIRRRKGDIGEFSLTHAFSPEDEELHKDDKRYQKEESFLSILTHSTSPGNMEPSRIFPVSRVQSIIKHVLEEHFGDRDYDQAYCSHLTPKVADIIKEKVKKIYLPRYKLISHVITGQIDGQTVRIASRCAWDERHDNYAEYMYKNYKMYAIGIVYAVYCE